MKKVYEQPCVNFMDPFKSLIVSTNQSPERTNGSLDKKIKDPFVTLKETYTVKKASYKTVKVSHVRKQD